MNIIISTIWQHVPNFHMCDVLQASWPTISVWLFFKFQGQRRLDKYQLLTHHDSIWPYLYGLACVDVQLCGDRDLNVGCYSKFIDLRCTPYNLFGEATRVATYLAENRSERRVECKLHPRALSRIHIKVWDGSHGLWKCRWCKDPWCKTSTMWGHGDVNSLTVTTL